LFDVATGSLADQLHDGSLTLTVAFSPDGKTLAWAGRNPTITLWDAQRQKPRAVCRGHEGPIRSVVFHPVEPVLVSVGFDGSIRFWDTPTGEPNGQPIRLQGRASNSVAISPDGTRLAANTGRRSDDRSLEGPIPGWIEIWDWATRRELRKIQGFQYD